MKIRFAEHITNMPVVEIMPDSGNFDTIDAVITVSFFDWDNGNLVYRPYVRANVSFGNRMSPKDAYFWGKCFEAAYQVADRIVISEHAQELEKAYRRVDTLNSFSGIMRTA